MQIFVTGATGWVGSAVVADLIGAGHKVAALVRSEHKAKALAESGVDLIWGTLDDLETLREAAAKSDAVVHTAFGHDFSRFAENALQDYLAIEAFGAALAGTDRPLVVTAGVGMIAPGRVATERDTPPSDPSYRRKSEMAARAVAARGARTAIVRLAPSVHGLGEHGFIPMLINLARAKGVSGYLGQGLNRWSGVHRRDAARVFRLVVEQTDIQPVYHAIGDEGVAFKEIATVIGRRLGVPVEPREPEHFGWLVHFAGSDMPASSQSTQAWLNWRPSGPPLLEDIDQPGYYAD